MNLLIDLAKALAARVERVVFTDLSANGNTSFLVELFGDVYSYNDTMGWFKPAVGDYAPDKYKTELRDRLMAGAAMVLNAIGGQVIATPATPPPPESHPLPPMVGGAAPAAPDTHKAYRPAPDDTCTRCGGSGKYPSNRHDGRCLWCEGNGSQSHGVKIRRDGTKTIK